MWLAGFLEQLVELDNDLRQHRELGLAQQIVLSTLEDRDSLPNPWNFEFWTQEVSVEDLGMPLVRLGEPHPMLINSTFSSVRTSTVPSRNLSRKPSSGGDYAKGLSRRSSLGVSNSFRRSRFNHFFPYFYFHIDRFCNHPSNNVQAIMRT